MLKNALNNKFFVEFVLIGAAAVIVYLLLHNLTLGGGSGSNPAPGDTSQPFTITTGTDSALATALQGNQ